MRGLSRRVLGVLAIVGLLAAACTPAAAPTPTAVPAKPTVAPAKPTATVSAAKPAETAVPSAKPASGQAAKPDATANWKSEWDKTVAAAKQEGKVVVAGGPGEMYRKASMPFQTAYPDIQLEFAGMQAPEFPPKVAAERSGGQFLWDVYLIGWKTPLNLMPRGILDPLKPALILPDVLDETKWHSGFADGWVDKDRQYIYQYQGRLTFMAYVNRNVAPESELSKVDQLLDPKWKGKISVLDPRVPGPTSSYFAYLIAIKGEDWVRKLMAQDLVIVKVGREQGEGVVRGNYPIALGMDRTDLEQFAREGLTANVEPLDSDSAAGRRLTGGYGNATLVNRAPHPNAAKMYLNWLLSKEGQTAWTEATGSNSRRLDVAGPPVTTPNPRVKYEATEKEWSPLFNSFDRAVEVAKEIFQ